MAGAASQAHDLFTVAGTNSGFGGAVDIHYDGNPSHVQYQDGLFYGTADAAAEYGTLHAYAHAKNLGNGRNAFATATSRFTDELIFTKGANSSLGNTGYFVPIFTIDGTKRRDYAMVPAAGIRYSGNNLFQTGNFTLNSGKQTYTGPLAIPFTYGVAFDFWAQLTVQVNGDNGYYGEAWSDYAHTARMTGYTVSDTNGTQVWGASLSTGSGVNYAAPVPEPCSMLALAVGAVGLLRRRRSA